MSTQAVDDDNDHTLLVVLLPHPLPGCGPVCSRLIDALSARSAAVDTAPAAACHTRPAWLPSGGGSTCASQQTSSDPAAWRGAVGGIAASCGLDAEDVALACLEARW